VLNRTLDDAWMAASRQFPVVLLTGPRQVGKTTALEHLCRKDRKAVSLDDPALRDLALRDPGLFLQRFEPPVLIDEIQYAPTLLPVIKSMVDRAKAPGLFWLTGSQQFHVMRGVSESLAGRVALLSLLGFSRRERHEKQLSVPPFVPQKRALQRRAASHPPLALAQVYKDIWLGSFPALSTGAVKDRDLFFRSYVATYLQRDVRDLAQVGDQSSFLRFLRACAARTAQLINLSDLARDADVSVNTAKSWLSILEGSFQIMRLQPYHTNVTSRIIKTPKLHFLDTGLCAYLTGWSSPETLEAGSMSGAIFETHVVLEVLKSFWHLGRDPQMYFYRDRDGHEVDLLIEMDDTLFPIEIKKTAQPSAQIARSFRALDSLKARRGPGAVVCFATTSFPLDESTEAVPAGLI
jgi:predicted AAA+ superfamily ATPase